MRKKFKLKISTYDNQPIIKVKAERIEDFEQIFKQVKKKFSK